jgi:hypothetical protein
LAGVIRGAREPQENEDAVPVVDAVDVMVEVDIGLDRVHQADGDLVDFVEDEQRLFALLDSALDGVPNHVLEASRGDLMLVSLTAKRE